jgi:hypothetical protein
VKIASQKPYLLAFRIVEDDDFGDPLSRLQMHVDEWDEVALATQ